MTERDCFEHSLLNQHRHPKRLLPLLCNRYWGQQRLIPPGNTRQRSFLIMPCLFSKCQICQKRLAAQIRPKKPYQMSRLIIASKIQIINHLLIVDLIEIND
ncbi:Hypothetical_protein [Hexamita inflata]|uniref:Hypothetical_protein n=1 Tax=Hexamita inflata TaxID=28002 RepID=A0AA86TMU7_9EUKA|nr:Hypothetical protein HINF_LOCUS11009 [Hexamita inflata]